MIMPVEQRCPKCQTMFMGSDAIGDPCPSCSRGLAKEQWEMDPTPNLMQVKIIPPGEYVIKRVEGSRTKCEVLAPEKYKGCFIYLTPFQVSLIRTQAKITVKCVYYIGDSI